MSPVARRQSLAVSCGLPNWLAAKMNSRMSSPLPLLHDAHRGLP
jgi:hypothetical protein